MIRASNLHVFDDVTLFWQNCGYLGRLFSRWSAGKTWTNDALLFVISVATTIKQFIALKDDGLEEKNEMIYFFHLMVSKKKKKSLKKLSIFPSFFFFLFFGGKEMAEKQKRKEKWRRKRRRKAKPRNFFFLRSSPFFFYFFFFFFVFHVRLLCSFAFREKQLKCLFEMYQTDDQQW